MAYLGKHIAFKVRYTFLQFRLWQNFSRNLFQPFDAVYHHQSYTLKASVPEGMQDIFPPCGTLLRHVEDTQHLPSAFLIDGKRHIESLAGNPPYPVNLDMHAVNEQHWIVFLQPSFKPLAYLGHLIQSTMRLILDLE